MLNRARSGGRGGPRQPFYPYPPERVLGHSRPLYAYLPFCLIRGKHSYKLVLSILGKGWYPYQPLPFSWATRFPLLVGAGGGGTSTNSYFPLSLLVQALMKSTHTLIRVCVLFLTNTCAHMCTILSFLSIIFSYIWGIKVSTSI